MAGGGSRRQSGAWQRRAGSFKQKPFKQTRGWDAGRRVSEGNGAEVEDRGRPAPRGLTAHLENVNATSGLLRETKTSKKIKIKIKVRGVANLWSCRKGTVGWRMRARNLPEQPRPPREKRLAEDERL